MYNKTKIYILSYFLCTISSRVYITMVVKYVFFSEYLMKVGLKDRQTPNFHFYHANISKLDNGRRTGIKQVQIDIDKFSPRRTLKAKSFFIISDNIYENKFYLGNHDIVMKLPRKMRRFWKLFKKTQKKCRKSSNRLHRHRQRNRERI